MLEKPQLQSAFYFTRVKNIKLENFITFQAITIFGAGDPKAMAGGISSALVTTVLGLLVAIPTVLLHTIVNGRAQKIIHMINEQATGIVAEHSEREHNG